MPQPLTQPKLIACLSFCHCVQRRTQQWPLSLRSPKNSGSLLAASHHNWPSLGAHGDSNTTGFRVGHRRCLFPLYSGASEHEEIADYARHHFNLSFFKCFLLTSRGAKAGDDKRKCGHKNTQIDRRSLSRYLLHLLSWFNQIQRRCKAGYHQRGPSHGEGH